MNYVHMAIPSRYDLLRSSTKNYFVSYLFACCNVIVIFFHKQIPIKKTVLRIDSLLYDS